MSDGATAIFERADLQKELQAVVRSGLARELHAATIIHSLSYRVHQPSELATVARDYAVKLKHNLARINAALPPPVRPPAEASALDAVTDVVLKSLTPRNAAYLLVKFLRHHTETPPEMLRPFGEQLRSKGFERLWQRALRDRTKLAVWLDRIEPDDTGTAPDGSAVASVEGGPLAADEAERRIPAAAPAAEQTEGVPRIFYRPQQIVRWM